MTAAVPCRGTLLAALALALLAPVSATQTQPSALALVGGALIDGTGAPRVEGVTVLLRGQRIAAVGRDVQVPADALVVDVAGKTLMPGLFDMHGHYYGNTGGKIGNLFEPYALLYLAGGVTTTFSPGDFDPEGMQQFRDRCRRGDAIAPRILTAGPYFDHDPSYIPWIHGIADADAAVQLLQRWRERIDGVKVYTRITEDELSAVLTAAHAAKLTVTGHLESVTATRAIELGIDRLEHGLFAMSEFARRGSEPFDLAYHERIAGLDLDGAAVQALIKSIVQHHVVVDPTIVVIQASLGRLDPVTAEIEKYFGDGVLDRWRRVESMRDRMTKRHGEAWPKAVDASLKKAKEFVGRVHRAGGSVVAGTDPVAITLLPGWALHRELSNFVDGGLTPLEALRCASYGAAKALGLAAELGTIEVGKRADLLIVAGDPSADLAALSRIETVIQDGVRHEAAALRRRAEGGIR